MSYGDARVKRAAATACGLALSVLGTGVASARVALEQVATGIDEPVYVAGAPGDPNRLFVVELKGVVRIIDHGQLRPDPYLDISRQVRAVGLRGMLSIAFAPDYKRSGRFYAFYTDRRGNIRVDRFTRSRTNADRASPGSRRNLLLQRIPRNLPEDHLGGQLQFGPDGYLYISMGDAGTGYSSPINKRVRNARDLHNLLGKILRIDPKSRGYAIPRTNPFRRVRGARGEIFAYGLRNPWRFSFDGHRIAIGDAGEDDREEIDSLSLRRARGADFGWPAFEGTLRIGRGASSRGLTMPALDYPHHSTSDPNCSGGVIGGYVVRDHTVPSLYGRYLYGDYCFAALRSFLPSAPRPSDAAVDVGQLPRLNSFGEDAAGHVFAAFEDGTVRELVER